MTSAENHLNTVTVPVGLGGKTTPYVPDPAPTILVEIASADAAHGKARVADLLASAETERLSLLTAAREEAAAIVAAAQDTVEARLVEAQYVASVREAELDEREARLVEDRADLDERVASLEIREADLTARLEAIDEEAASAASALAAARDQATAILGDAQEAADLLLEEARTEAENEAGAIRARVREQAEAREPSSELLAELESVHRIEVQVLREREADLVEQIVLLRERLARAEEIADHSTPDTDYGASGRHMADVTSVTEIIEVLEVDVTTSQAMVEVPRPSEQRVRPAGGDGANRIAAHTPLTEQLSTTAFRSAAGSDRRGRRRR
jgi:hypothetical protein